MPNFTKMHGLGNDYVYMDAINQNIERIFPVRMTLF